jgi:hypothetical protein
MPSIGSGGARHIRRWITRISVGGRPPDWHPSGAGLTRGPRLPTGLFTPSRVAPPRGGASSTRHGTPAGWRVQCRPSEAMDGVIDTCWAMAPRKPASSRAMATTTGWACVPRASRRRERLHSRTGAFHLRSWLGLGSSSSWSCQWRLTVAGSREAQAPSTKARRAWVWPVLVLDPCRRRSALASAEGIRPRSFITGRGCSTRVRSPSSGHEGHGHGAWHAAPAL